MSTNMKRRVTVLATVISCLLIAGVVFAAFTADATGAGSAQSFEIALDSTIEFDNAVAGLYPGHVEQVEVTITNTQEFPVEVTSTSGLTAVQDDATECDETVVTASWVDGEDPAGTALDAAGGTTDSTTATLNVAMAEGAGNACANAPFDFELGALLTSVPDAS